MFSIASHACSGSLIVQYCIINITVVYESVEAINFLGYYVLEFLLSCLFGLKNLGLTVGI